MQSTKKFTQAEGHVHDYAAGDPQEFVGIQDHEPKGDGQKRRRAKQVKGVTATLDPWVIDETATADLSDKRLNDRLSEVLSQFAGHPNASIPAACGGYAETAGAYRLFDNKKVCFENVLQPHIDATRRRVAEQPVVIACKIPRNWS